MFTEALLDMSMKKAKEDIAANIPPNCHVSIVVGATIGDYLEWLSVESDLKLEELAFAIHKEMERRNKRG